MSTYSQLTRTALVQHGFTEEGVWRDTLGPCEPLRVAVTDGPIDAPEYLPAGGQHSSKWGPVHQIATRSEN